MNPQEKQAYEALYGLVKNDYSRAIADQTAVWEGRSPERQPLLLSLDLPTEYEGQFPRYTPTQVHHDQNKMLLEGMCGMAATSLAGMHGVPSIRANMGCGIYPSLFPGITSMLFEDDKMPWVQKHLTLKEIDNLCEEDIKITDEFKLALDHMAYQAEMIDGTGAFVYPLDLQGPFDMAHIVYGDPFFYDLYDEPELMHHLLNLCCYAIELGVAECLKVMPRSQEYIAHYNGVVLPRSLGGFKISEDTSTIVGAGHIDEFVMPYTDRILKATNGAYIHYCGRNDHLLKRVLAHPMVCGLNFGNPEKHDMDEVLRQTAAAGKVFYGASARHDGESEADFFERSLRAATVDGLCKLILVHHGGANTRQAEVEAAWAAACAKVGLPYTNAK